MVESKHENTTKQKLKTKYVALQQIEIRPGMTATLDIKTGTRSVLSFLMKPLTKTFGDAMGER